MVHALLWTAVVLGLGVWSLLAWALHGVGAWSLAQGAPHLAHEFSVLIGVAWGAGSAAVVALAVFLSTLVQRRRRLRAIFPRNAAGTR